MEMMMLNRCEAFYPEKQSLDRIPPRQDTPGRINYNIQAQKPTGHIFTNILDIQKWEI